MKTHPITYALTTIAFLLISLQGNSEANADIVRKFETKELINKSSLIAKVEVISVDPNAQDSDGPLTKITFYVEDLYCGSVSGSYIDFWVEGGFRVGTNKYLEVVGAPQFKVGEKYIVFISSGTWKSSPITNFHHSYFWLKKINNKYYLFNQDGFVAKSFDIKDAFVLGRATPDVAPFSGHFSRIDVRSSTIPPLNTSELVNISDVVQIKSQITEACSSYNLSNVPMYFKRALGDLKPIEILPP